MEPTIEQNQTTAPVSEPVVVPAPSADMPVSAPAKHGHALYIVVLLLVVAAVLFWIVNATQQMHTDTDSYMPETTGSAGVYSEPVPGAGENDAATQAESDAIRADLESESIDGTSEAL
jgi:hypothetical protein